ncbi:putative [Myosin heavy-chain] kinase transcription factor WD40-like family [Helianthus annuus]|nr:putative [Myosin heavy-chain] kinase transcription factor WD40-like family [Helianthus annuus]
MPHLQILNSQDESQSQFSYYHLPITHNCILTIKHKSSYISSLSIGGKLLYTGSSDKEIQMLKRDNLRYEYDRENLNNSVIITGKGAVKSLVVSADKIYSAHQDHRIRVWKVDENDAQQKKLTQLATLPTFSDRALTNLTPKNHVQVRRHKKSTWVHHNDAVSALAVSRDGLVLYSVSWDRTLKIWRTTDFKCLESVANAHDDAINAVALSSHGDVYTGSTDKKIKIWRKLKSPKGEKHSLIATLKKHRSGINALALSTDENVLYSGASDRLIIVWEKSDDDDGMVVVCTLKGHVKSILCLSVASDLLCSGSADETIRIWRGIEKCYFCLAVLEGHSGPVKCLTSETDHFSLSDTSASYIIYSGGLDSDIKVWQILIPL